MAIDRMECENRGGVWKEGRCIFHITLDEREVELVWDSLYSVRATHGIVGDFKKMDELSDLMARKFDRHVLGIIPRKKGR